MHEYDKCGKYMIQRHGNAILLPGRVDDVDAWTALQAEPVQTRQLPTAFSRSEVGASPGPISSSWRSPPIPTPACRPRPPATRR